MSAGEYKWCKSIGTVDGATTPRSSCIVGVELVVRMVKIDITIGREIGKEGMGAFGSSDRVESGMVVNPNYKATSRFHNGNFLMCRFTTPMVYLVDVGYESGDVRSLANVTV